jgi:diadenosine tetraphosphate (Ap4A) HIT family hydrolase
MQKKKNLLFETKHWIAILDYNQSELGRTLLMLKRHCPKVSEITKEEQLDFIEALKKIDACLKKSFDCNLINISCLMNHAYRTSPPNPHVHWHIRPRHNKKIKFEEMIFDDQLFGSHYNPKIKNIISEENLLKIENKLKENI